MWLKCKYTNNASFANVIRPSATAELLPQSDQAHKRHEAAGRWQGALEAGVWDARFNNTMVFSPDWMLPDRNWLSMIFKITFYLSEFEVSCLAARCYDWRIRFVAVFMLFGNFTVPQENGKNPIYEVFQKSTTQKFIVMRLCNFLYRNICTYRVFSKAVLDEPLLWFSCYEGMCAYMHAIHTYICTYMHT